MSTLDYIVLLAYLIGVIWVGLRMSGKQVSVKDYFLGGKDLPWWAVCFSIVATETSTLTIIGIPAVAFGGTMVFLQITIGYLLGRTIVALVFLPRYFAGELTTAYDYLGQRFGPRMQTLSSITFMGTRLLADGVRLFATAIPLKVIADSTGMDVGYPIIIVSIGLLTMSYTYMGGLKAVVWMDVIQMGLYLLAAIGSIWVLLSNLPEGGLAILEASGKLMVFDFGNWEINSILTQPYVFVTAVIGGGIFSMASHGTDHLIVQRLLACRTLADSKKALIGSAFIVALQFAIFLVVGALLWVYYGGASLAELGLSRGDEVFPRFILEGLPSGVSGLVLAGILAAAMSTLSSSLNALASSTLTDVLSKVRAWNEANYNPLKASRLITLMWGIVFMFFATLFEDQKNPVVELGLSIASFTYGSLLGAFVLGMLSERVKEKEAMIAFGLTIIVMVGVIFGVWYGPDTGWIFVFKPDAAVIAAGNLKSIAWPWYTAIGSVITIVVGTSLSYLHK
ncbi:MAG: sodium:solute symporter [Bacteroidetes bacterium]|nr:MAG: sodium:solute symporter [Bacteroidota bacterium]